MRPLLISLLLVLSTPLVSLAQSPQAPTSRIQRSEELTNKERRTFDARKARIFRFESYEIKGIALTESQQQAMDQLIQSKKKIFMLDEELDELIAQIKLFFRRENIDRKGIEYRLTSGVLMIHKRTKSSER